jgi:hypothetical protein
LTKQKKRAPDRRFTGSVLTVARFAELQKALLVKEGKSQKRHMFLTGSYHVLDYTRDSGITLRQIPRRDLSIVRNRRS